MAKRTPRTLFFINGVTATAEEQAEADELKGAICFRNVQKYRPEDSIEDFDHVAGAVPENYANAARLKALAADGAPVPPLASTTAPAAPQQAATGAGGAKPTGGAGAAWKPN